MLTASGDGTGCVLVLRKGEVDSIAAVHLSSGVSDDHATEYTSLVTDVDDEGSPRRCGGQGDVLAGIFGTFLAWSARRDVGGRAAAYVSPHDMLACAISASRVTRTAARLSFSTLKRSMTTPDVISNIGRGFQHVHPDALDH
jgi:ATP-dependent NAD(P)H-hydrate dehydratase